MAPVGFHNFHSSAAISELLEVVILLSTVNMANIYTSVSNNNPLSNNELNISIIENLRHRSPIHSRHQHKRYYHLEGKVPQ